VSSTLPVGEKTIGDYLLERLHFYGVEHVFGIPGDFIVTWFHQLEVSGKIAAVNTCDEQGSGFAADGYARIRGLGVTAQTWGVGGVKALHNAASAYAERVPVVFISGAPGLKERVRGPILHHTIRDFESQYRMYAEVTVARAMIDNPKTAFAEIDRVLHEAMRHSRPVYLELPRDQVMELGNPDHIPAVFARAGSNPTALNSLLEGIKARLETAQRPVFLAGVELGRLGLLSAFETLLERSSLPFASTVLGKGLVRESHPQFVGVYQGALGDEQARAALEDSDFVLTLGMVITDVNLGLFTAKLELEAGVFVNSDRAALGGAAYEGITLEGVLHGLLEHDWLARTTLNHSRPPIPFVAQPETLITAQRLMEALAGFLDEGFCLCADNGEPLVAGAALNVHSDQGFFAPGYYTSLGFSVPMALGVQLARPSVRPLVLCGDGAFQMTGVETSTQARLGLNPIVVVMDNGGYGSERPFYDEQYVNTHRWNYSRFTEVIGAGLGFEIRTESDLEAALEQAKSNTDSPSILDVKLEHFDYSDAFARFLAKFSAK
jgi:TPP-dependent 2-oxoacid decarboxylase